MKNLPEEFCIKHAINPLWGKFINWLNKYYFAHYNGMLPANYYGIRKHENGKIIAYNNCDEFATIITLEEWDGAINSLCRTVPTKWCISRSLSPSENEAVTNWVNSTFDVSFRRDKIDGYYLIDTNNFKINWGADKLDYEEISFKEFNFHILDDKYVEPKVPKLIGYKAPINLFDDMIIAGDVLVIQDRPNTYQVKRIPKYFTLPHEIVESWEKVFEEESIKLIIGSKNDGVLITKNSIKFNNEIIIDIKQLKATVKALSPSLSMGIYPVVLIYDDLNSRKVRIGCKNENHLFSINELQSVIDAYEKLNKE